MSMSILQVIDDANKEYLANGRSDRFVAMEDSIIESQKMANIYRFARYVRGAKISRLQSEVLKNGKMSDCFYFAKGIKGVNFWKFFERALAEKNEFWVHKFVCLAASPFGNHKNGLRDYKDELKDEFGIEIDSKRKGDIQGLKNYNIDKLIELAKKEYSLNGRSKQFIALEDYVIYTTGKGADILIFAKYVPGVNLKKLQKALIMHGDAFDMYLFAQEIENSDPALLASGAELALYDYTAIDENEKYKLARIKKCKAELNSAIESQKSEKTIRALYAELRQAEDEESYSIMVGRYKARIERLASSNRFGKK